MLQNLLSNFGGWHFLLRFLHVFFAIIWIGLLYYFNFVQGAFFAETDAPTKSQATQKLVPRALWWFRYAALATWIMGFLMLMMRSHLDVKGGGTAIFASAYWISILTGSLLGTIMFLNVWGIIWRNQKVVIQNAITTASGGAANPAAAISAAKAALASRTNVLFSIPMLFFMLSASHFGYEVTDSSMVTAYWLIAFAIIGAIEANAIWGKQGVLTTIKGVITSGFVLTLGFVILISVLI